MPAFRERLLHTPPHFRSHPYENRLLKNTLELRQLNRMQVWIDLSTVLIRISGIGSIGSCSVWSRIGTIRPSLFSNEECCLGSYTVQKLHWSQNSSETLLRLTALRRLSRGLSLHAWRWWRVNETFLRYIPYWGVIPQLLKYDSFTQQRASN